MLYRLLVIALTFTILSLATAPLNISHAATRRTHLHYAELVKIFVLTRASAIILTPTAIPTPTMTPLINQIPTISPTATITVLPTSRLTAIQTPIATVTAKPVTPTTAPVITATPASDSTSYIMGEINKYRISQGLSLVKTSDETCSFAATRAKEISSNFSHDGFNTRSNNRTIPYATWTKVTENLAMTSQYTDVVNMWANSPGHAENMRDDTPFVCVQQYGNYFAYEGMKP